MAKDWMSAVDVVTSILECYESDTKFIRGECNCNRCVEERINAQIKDKWNILHEYFNPSLSIWTLEGNDLLSLIKVFNSKLVHKSDNQKILSVLQDAAQKNINREQKVPASKKVTCHVCGVLLNDTKCYHFNKKPICQICAKIYNQCDECKEFCKKTELRTFSFIRDDGGTYTKEICTICISKYLQCEFCSEMFLKSKARKIALDGRGDRSICPFCYDNKLTNCADCGMLMYNRMDLVPKGESLYCEDCYAYKKPINAWNFKPKPIFCCEKNHVEMVLSKDRVDTLFFGVELEIEQLEGCGTRNQDMALHVRGMFPSKQLYAVTDGTLVSGFELVTQPFTWLNFLEREKLWMEVFKTFKEYRYGTGQNAGMHVHMSKSAFTTLHLYKFIQFLYKQSTRSFLTNIAQRNINNNQHCRFDSLDIEKSKIVAKHKDNLCRDKHHCAVNLENYSTVEIRIFRMPDSYKEFRKNLEFLYGLYNFTRDASVKNIVVFDFVKYIVEHRDKYKYLINYISGNKNILGRYSNLKSILN